MTVWLPILMSMNRRQFFQRSAAVAALCADGMLPSSLEAQSPAAPLPSGAEAAAVATINPTAGVRVAGLLMVPAVGGKYKVWTKRLGSGKTKVLLLHGGPAMQHDYLEAMESFPPDAGIEMYYYDQLGCGTPTSPKIPAYGHSNATPKRWKRCGAAWPGELCALWPVVGRHTGD
jgi:proline iminopeptidase